MLLDDHDADIGARIAVCGLVYGAIMGVGQLPRPDFTCAVDNRLASVTTSGVLSRDTSISLKEKDGQAWRVIFTKTAGYSGFLNDPNLLMNRIAATRFCKDGFVPNPS